MKFLEKKISILATIAYVIAFCLITVVLTTLGYTYLQGSIIGSAKEDTLLMQKIRTIKELYDSKYIDDLDLERFVDGIGYGMVLGSGDPYGAYFSRSDYESMLLDRSGQTVGIGITVAKDEEGYIKVVRLVPGGPAERAGFMASDTILEIAGQSTIEMDILEARTLILGAEDTWVDFVIRRSDEQKHLSAQRGVFNTSTVSFRVIGEDTGYLLIEDFNEQTPQLFDKAIEELNNTENLKGYIFDVRNNSGGNLESICAVLDSLIDSGTIVKLVDKNGEVQSFEATEGGIDAKMVVLTNQSTASAAELFVGTLKERCGATIVGETTYGKWVAQETFTFTDGTAISITDTMFYTGLGQNYNGVGILPDEIVAFPKELLSDYYLLNEETDPQLKAAVEALSKK